MNMKGKAVAYFLWALKMAGALAVFHASTTVLLGSAKWMSALAGGNVGTAGAWVQALQDSQTWRVFLQECAAMASAGALLGIWVGHAKLRRQMGLEPIHSEQE